MKRAFPLLLAAALMISAPAAVSARPGDGDGGRGDRMRQDWRAQERYPRGPEGPDRGDGRYGRGRGPDAGEGQGEGRYGRRLQAGEGPDNAEPPQRRRDSLGRGWNEPQDSVREGVRSGQLRPLGQVLPELSRRQPGRMLDTGIEDGPGGRPVYRVRWAARDGRRMDFIVDARTGAILSTEGQ